MILADVAFRAGSGSVEITKGRIAPAIRGGVIGQGPLDGQLASAIGIDRFLLFTLRDRYNLGNAVGGTGAREHETPNLMPAQAFHQTQSRAEVVLIILGRIADRLANETERGKVNDRLDPLLQKSLIQ